MSVESMAMVLHHSKARGTQKLILLGIANHEGDGGAFPAVATLAKYANVNNRTVQYAIRELVASGELAVQYNAGGTAQVPAHERPNMYRVLVACPPDCDRTANHRCGHPVTSSNTPVQSAAPPPVQATAPGASHCTTPVQSAAPPPVQATAPEPSFEPSMNHPLPPSSSVSNYRADDPLGRLGLTEGERAKVLDLVKAGSHGGGPIRSMSAYLTKLVRNGDISTYVDTARQQLADHREWLARLPAPHRFVRNPEEPRCAYCHQCARPWNHEFAHPEDARLGRPEGVDSLDPLPVDAVSGSGGAAAHSGAAAEYLTRLAESKRVPAPSTGTRRVTIQPPTNHQE